MLFLFKGHERHSRSKVDSQWRDSIRKLFLLEDPFDMVMAARLAD
jgi:hypothetical protein